MTLSRPRQSIIKLNPGPVPEARQLESLTRALAHVRSQIIRETMGAVSPKQQLKAVDLLMQRHHDAIAALLAASRRQGRVLAPVDGIQLIVSVIEHATMASYWLQLAKTMRKIPSAPDQREQSPQKSRQHRMRVLNRIKSNCQLVVDLMDELSSITPQRGRRLVEQLFETFDLRILSVQILATFSATYTASGGPSLPASELDEMLTELDQVRLSPTFSSRSVEDQDLLWNTISVVQEARGNQEEVRAALVRRRRLVGRDLDSRLLLLVDLIAYFKTDEERLALINELKDLAKDVNAGPIFSRDRLGRMSIFRDSYWYVAAEAELGEVIGRALFSDCFLSYEEWLYGRSGPFRSGAVRLFTTWRGSGGIVWRSNDGVEKQAFTLDPELVTRLFVATETRGSATERKVLQDVNVHLTKILGQALDEAFDYPGEKRLQAVGQMGALPVLATLVAGGALGSSFEVAYRHPNAEAEFRSEGISGSVQLAIIDNCFEGDARTVKAAAHLAASKERVECEILEFNSGTDALSVAKLLNALRSVSSAVLFCHVVSPITSASSTGLVLGPSSVLTVDSLASLDLDGLEELVLIGCASGRSNPFLGEVTLAHAMALAGVGEILYTIWPIRPSVGSRFLSGMFEARSKGQTMREYLAEKFSEDPLRAAPFAIMRP